MIPDQEKLIRDYLEDVARERAAGHTLEAVHRTTLRLFDEVHEIRSRVAVLERWRKDVRRWWGNRSTHEPPREPMPTLNPDDSGSIDISILGSGAKFKGPLPVKFAGALLIVAALLASGWGLHAAIAHDAVHITPPTFPGVHP